MRDLFARHASTHFDVRVVYGTPYFLRSANHSFDLMGQSRSESDTNRTLRTQLSGLGVSILALGVCSKVVSFLTSAGVISEPAPELRHPDLLQLLAQVEQLQCWPVGFTAT
jgi:hypothetical protein